MNQRWKNAILFWGAALAAIGPVLIDPAQPKATAPPLATCLPCTVNTIHDGDTATDVVIELHVQVRYDHCWAPELSAPGGNDSFQTAKTAEGKHGRLYIPLNNAGNVAALFTFGRVIGELWIDGANESESQRQVRLKMASTTKGGKLGE